jgi:CDGSH-type Zn-finger protein
MKPCIACLPNGPYYLIHDTTPQPVANLKSGSGEGYSATRGVALCRCGGSKNKPFCDGTHGTNGFKSATLADPAKNKRATYVGKSITIFDNRAICAHAGFCTDGLKEVFLEDSNPWIAPDGATVEKVIETIRKCPSGALSYALNGIEATADSSEATVTVTPDGPYAVTGGMELMGVAFGDGASKEHYTLCRCGQSKNKPFCDGSHWGAGFKDPE